MCFWMMILLFFLFIHKYHSIYGDWKYIHSHSHSHAHIHCVNLPFIYLLCKLIHLIRLYICNFQLIIQYFTPVFSLLRFSIFVFFCVFYFEGYFMLYANVLFFFQIVSVLFFSFYFFLFVGVFANKFSALQIVFCAKKQLFIRYKRKSDTQMNTFCVSVF